MRKLGIICMILLFSIGAVGMGCAGWHDVISTRYDVATGIVSAGIRNHGTNDYGSDPCSHGSPNRENRNIGYTRCGDGPYKYKLDGKSYSENIEVDIYGYRSYAPVCTLEMANCGSIPVKADQILIDWDGDLASNIQVGNWSIDCPDGYRKEGKGLSSLGGTIKYLCLDPGQKMWLDLEFRVGEKNNLKENLEVVNKAFNTALIINAAEAAENNQDSSAATATNTTEADPASGSEKNNEPPPDNNSSPPVETGEPATEAPDSRPPGDEPTASEATSNVPVDALPEEPVSKATGGSSVTGINAAPEEIQCGSATGTITITYRRWNEQWR
ncbi:hypothetical protein [Desulfoscipio gibsoniae]